VGDRIVVLEGAVWRAGEAVRYSDGGGVSRSLVERFDRVKARLAELMASGIRPFGYESKDLALHPTVDEAEISAFEERHGVILPLEYRAFLMWIGDGGAGPGYGMFRLHRTVWDYDRTLPGDFLRTAFRHQEAYDSDRDPEFAALCDRVDRGEIPEEVLDRLIDYEVAGSLALCDEGCGYIHRLVVTGPARGTIWIDGRGGSGGIIPLRVTFLEWYERWLESALAGQGGCWWLSPPPKS